MHKNLIKLIRNKGEKMEKFNKITEKYLFENGQEKIMDKVVKRVRKEIEEKISIQRNNLIYSISECESPIEQLLALTMENMNLLGMFNFNPLIDIVSIEKQCEIKCNKNKYRVDFLITVYYPKQEKGKCFVIECDGYEFHQKTKEQVRKDYERDRLLQANNYEILRFSGSEIYKDPEKCVFCILKNINSKM